MIVFQNTVAHSFPARNILCGFYVVGMVRNFSDKNNSGVVQYSIVGNSVCFNVISVFDKLIYHRSVKSAAGIMPELYRCFEFFYIAVPQSDRKCVEQKFSI